MLAPVGVAVAETTPALTRALKIPLMSGIGAGGAVEVDATGGTVGGRRRATSIDPC